MASLPERTFKDVQMEERYKKLERTLKMVLLKNAADRRSNDNGNTDPTWPSLSSINCDQLDTSCTGASVHSSRTGSVVVSSSRNLRNVLLHKSEFSGNRNNIATSSENQFPINKEDDDSAMMPPPRSSDVFSMKSKRFHTATKTTPLVNLQLNSGKNDSAFSMSTSASSIASTPKCTEPTTADSSVFYQEKNNYNNRKAYNDVIIHGGQQQERIFTRWRVLLNDKEQLIIKGTLDCGKIARSKPVVKRLTSTSVQSIFKHIYHLRGNLVDDRNELPDYVRGKFYNGFPDDWENVYQLWRNFVNDGSRLSFRWPTPVTDSDDDIKSEITEISYYPHFDRYKKSLSPRKRNRFMNSSQANAVFIADKENRNDISRCSCTTYDVSNETQPQINAKVTGNLSRNESKAKYDGDYNNVDVAVEKSKKAEETSTVNLTTPQRSSVNSLKDIIQEDKLNIIIDNLTNKNCPMEYINKIVEMFDGLKFVVSYQSSQENDSEKSKEINNSVVNEKETSQSPKKKDCSTEEKGGSVSVSNANNREKSAHSSITEIAQYEQRPCTYPNPNAIEESYKDQYVRQTRRKLTKHDYDSTESDSDFYDNDSRRKSIRRPSTTHGSHERLRKSHKYKMNDRQNIELAKSFERSSMSVLSSATMINARAESCLSEDDCSVHSRSDKKAGYTRAYTSPKKRKKPEVDRRQENARYDSSISFTEDDNDDRYTVTLKERRTKNMLKETYDSSVSITEDEFCDNRGDHSSIDSLKYHPTSIARSVESNTNRNPSNQGSARKITSFVDPIMNNYTRDSVKISSAPPKDYDVSACPSIDNFVGDQQEDSAYLSSELKRHQKSSLNEEIVGTESIKSYVANRSNESKFVQNSETSEMPPPKTTRLSQLRKMPTVISNELSHVDPKSHNWIQLSNDKGNDKNMSSTPIVHIERIKSKQSTDDPIENPINQKSTAELFTKNAKIVESTKRGPVSTVKAEQKESSMIGNETEGNKKTASKAKSSPNTKYGTEANPKVLTAWVPAVICNKFEKSNYNLIFEGKLLNEAGHVVNRKFTTDFVRRRISPKLFETINHEYYQLIGDLNDTKHVVPKELIKLCHSGCPGKIASFCEKWVILSTNNSKNRSKENFDDTSIDILDMPTSSRGRRILPPLSYWTGERVALKDNQAIYNPGKSEECSGSSILERSNEDATIKRNSPKKQQSRASDVLEAVRKRSNEAKDRATKKKDMDKISPTNLNKSPAKSLSKNQDSRKSQRLQSIKRRIVKDLGTSSSESDEDQKPTARRKGKMRENDPMPKIERSSHKKSRNSSKNTASSQNLENANVNSSQSNVENIPQSDTKSKLRKRQRIDHVSDVPTNSGTIKQYLIKRPPGITCTYYNNVPLRDDDLSEDQLSTI